MRRTSRTTSSAILTILFSPLLGAWFGLYSSPVYADTVLNSAWQEFMVHAFAWNGASGESVNDYHQANASIIGARTYSAQVHNPGNSIGANSGTAQASVTQSVALGGIGFQFTGSLSGYAEGYDVAEEAVAHQFYNFDVVGHSETLTIDISSLVLVNASEGFHYAFSGNGIALGNHLGAPEYQQFSLAPGSYSLVLYDTITENQSSSLHRSATYDGEVGFSNLVIAPGALQSNPLVTGASPDYSYYFDGVPNHKWIDPAPSSEILYQTIDGALFTQIEGLPTGFAQPFEVVVNGASLGFFDSNQSVNFTELLGHGVPSFTIRNIQPGIDPSSETAFPIQLAFNRETASFTMTPIPEPSTLMLAAVGLIGLVVYPRQVSRRAQPTTGVISLI